MSPTPPEAVRYAPFDQILEAARNGDKEAQGQLLELCRRPLLRLARRELRPSVQGKVSPSDVVQEAFVKALREIGAFQGCTPEQLLAWLRVILEHTLSNFQRQFHTAKREVRREVSDDAAARPEGPRNAAPSAVEEASRRETAARVRAALARLPAHYVEVVRLRVEEQLAFEEIGARTGRTTEAARKIWTRAVIEVADVLDGRGT